MKDLILFLFLACIGYFLGSRLRNHRSLTVWTGHFQTGAIVLLIFSMGLRMGSNEEVIGNLASIGLLSAMLAVLVMAVSAVSATLVRKFIGMDRFAGVKNTGDFAPYSHAADQPEDSRKPETEKNTAQRIMAILILCSVVSGLASGYIFSQNAAASSMEFMTDCTGIIVNAGLSVLLFLAGVNIGIDGTVADSFRKIGFKILLFPAAAMASSLLAAVLFAAAAGYRPAEMLTVCSGFGWYTIASAIILDKGLVTCAAIAFMHNLLREYFTLLSVPLLAKKIGYMETVSMAGGTAMGVCLPVIAKSTRSDVTVYSFISGLIHAASVPVLIPLFLSL